MGALLGRRPTLDEALTAAHIAINVTTQQEFSSLVSRASRNGYPAIKRLSKCGFDKLHYSCGRLNIAYGDLCIMYNANSGGFAIGDKQKLRQLGFRIFTVDELM